MSMVRAFIQYGIPFLTSLAISILLTPLVKTLAIRYKFISHPASDRWHKHSVASFGGIAIFAAFLVPYLIFAPRGPAFLGFIFGALGIFWLGLVDDVARIKPDSKLIGQIIIACMLVMSGVNVNIGFTPIISMPLTIFWIVGIINAFNLLDNMDGLCAGIAAISALMLCIHSIINNNTQLVVLLFIILGASIGFLRYNFNPAKIFMGDCGSMFLGYALSVGALIGTAKERSGLLITMAIPVLVLAVPIFDTAFVTLVRSLYHRPISQGGKDHTSHRLVALGLSERNAVLLLYGVSVVCGAAAVLYTMVNFVIIAIMLSFLFIGLFIFGVFLGSEVDIYSPEEVRNLTDKKKLNGKIIFNGFIYNKRRIAEVLLDFIIISTSYVAAFFLRFEGALFNLNIPLILESLPILLIIKFLMFYSFGLYRGVWRYIGLYDIIAIFKAATLGSILSIVAILFLFRFRNYSRSVFIIDWLITFVSVSGVRILFRLYKEFFANIRVGGRRVLIFGAGDAGELTLREIRQNRFLGYKPIGFIDDDKEKFDRVIHGVKVVGQGGDLEKLIYRYKIDEVLVAIPASNKRRLSEIYGICSKVNIPFREVSKIIQIKEELGQ